MKRRKKVAVVRCFGSAAMRMKQEGRQEAGSCNALKETDTGDAAACPWGCLGGGSCAEACPKDAITLTEGKPARVDTEICIGCGKCVKTCPQQLISLVPAENVIQPLCSSTAGAKETRAVCSAGCIGCGICEKACPAGAVHVVDQHAVIDQECCIACGMCAVKCPRGVIHDRNGIFTIS